MGPERLAKLIRFDFGGLFRRPAFFHLDQLKKKSVDISKRTRLAWVQCLSRLPLVLSFIVARTKKETNDLINLYNIMKNRLWPLTDKTIRLWDPLWLGRDTHSPFIIITLFNSRPGADSPRLFWICKLQWSWKNNQVLSATFCARQFFFSHL